jgi:hypothetical protein
MINNAPVSQKSSGPESINPMDAHLMEFIDYLRPYFNGTRTPMQAWQLFEKEGAELQAQLLAQPGELAGYLDDSPQYVAAPLFGKVKFQGGPAIKKLRQDYRQITTEELREAKCLKVDPSVRSLLDAIPSGKLPKILALCALAEQSPQLKVPSRH